MDKLKHSMGVKGQRKARARMVRAAEAAAVRVDNAVVKRGEAKQPRGQRRLPDENDTTFDGDILDLL